MWWTYSSHLQILHFFKGDGSLTWMCAWPSMQGLQPVFLSNSYFPFHSPFLYKSLYSSHFFFNIRGFCKAYTSNIGCLLFAFNMDSVVLALVLVGLTLTPFPSDARQWACERAQLFKSKCCITYYHKIFGIYSWVVTYSRSIETSHVTTKNLVHVTLFRIPFNHCP